MPGGIMTLKRDINYYKFRFLRKLTKRGSCLLFSASKNWKGYGQFHNPYDPIAHRFAWIIENGPIPDGMMVLHSCDVRNCCQILHLKLGTAKENTKDMIDRKRQNVPKGSEHYNSKINEEDAKEIKKMISNNVKKSEISKKLNISVEIIRDIKRKKTWKYVESFFCDRCNIEIIDCSQWIEKQTNPLTNELYCCECLGE